MKKIYFVTLIVIILSFFANPLYALDSEFTIVFSETPPYSFKDEDGNSKGFFLEAFEGTLKEMDIFKVEFKLLGFKRLINFIETGNADCTFGSKNSKRAEFAHYSDEFLLSTHWGYFIKKSEQSRLKFD